MRCKCHSGMLLFFFIFIASQLSVFGHSVSNSSTVLIETKDNQWLLQISSALTAFEFEIENEYGKSAYDTPEEFEQLVLEFVSKNVSVLVNGEALAVLQNGIVQLGHETRVTFQLARIPNDFQDLQVHNGSFSNIARNKSIVYILKSGFAKEQFTLSEVNAHTVNLKAADAKFELVVRDDSHVISSLWIMIIVIIGISAMAYFGYRFTKAKQLNSSITT